METDSWPIEEGWLDDWVDQRGDDVCMVGYDQRSHEKPPRRHRDSYMIGLYNTEAYYWLKGYLAQHEFPYDKKLFTTPHTKKELESIKSFFGPISEIRPLTKNFPRAKKRQKRDGCV